MRARDRRREAKKAHVAAHLELKREIEARRESSIDLCTVYISIPPFVRQSLRLTNRMARVKTVMDRAELNDTDAVRRNLSGVLINLFPELQANAVLRHEHDFDLRICGRDVRDTESLMESVRIGGEACSSLFVEIIPHNLPAAKSALSVRWGDARQRAESDRNATSKLRMVSFYKFAPIADPIAVAARLKKFWGMLGILGRIYVASEGVNAQMAVPEETWQDFVDAMNGQWMERGKPLVPASLIGVYLNEDGSIERSEQPFDALHVRSREKVLADGLDSSLDWASAGKVLSPEDWHKELGSKDAILVDCRNKYETDVGHFEGAEKPNTQTFRGTWGWLENRLKDVDRNAPIMTYCTGGIRCVKVNAYLEQKMGFKNTSRLGGGIVSYARKLEENGRLEESKFRGVNHVFDGRVGREITNDTLSTCLNCGQRCDTQTDCAFIGCKRPFDTRMFVQCTDCAALLRGACSQECSDAISNGGRIAGRVVEHEKKQASEKTAESSFSYVPAIDKDSKYADEFSSTRSELLHEIREISDDLFPGRSHMLSGAMQGALLAMLVRIAGCKRVLELGTYLGYSALCMAEALPSSGRLVTCESDAQVAEAARRILSRYAEKGAAAVDLKVCAASRLLSELGTSGSERYDMAFVDANKGGYVEYYERILEYDLVRQGGLMVFDNVLFKGLVAKDWYNRGMENNILHFSQEEQAMIRSRQRSIRKAHKIAKKLHAFNEHVRADSRTEQVLLPVRDGLLVIRVK